MVHEAEAPAPLLTAALEIQAFCEKHGWRACAIGGLAVLRWGRPRATRDVDISLLTGFGSESPFIDRLLATFKPRASDVRRFALDHRVLLLRASNGTPLDVALAGIPFEEQMMDRASPHEFATNFRIVTASAEDIVVLKAFASRTQDWLDIEGILAIRNDELDWSQIQDDLKPLAELKEEPEILERLNQLRRVARAKSE